MLKYKSLFNVKNAISTLQNIKKLGNKYFPATFRYLYQLYMLEPEKDLDLNETGLIYLLKELKCLCIM